MNQKSMCHKLWNRKMSSANSCFVRRVYGEFMQVHEVENECTVNTTHAGVLPMNDGPACVHREFVAASRRHEAQCTIALSCINCSSENSRGKKKFTGKWHSHNSPARQYWKVNQRGNEIHTTKCGVRCGAWRKEYFINAYSASERVCAVCVCLYAVTRALSTYFASRGLNIKISHIPNVE